MRASETTASIPAQNRASAKTFEVPSVCSAVVITAMTLMLAGAAWLLRRSSGGGYAIDAMARYIGMTMLVAVRSPAPALMLALALERWLPIADDQRTLTRGFSQDFGWYGVDYIREITWIPLMFALLLNVKHCLMGNRDLFSDRIIPAPIFWIIGILTGDALAYWSHRLRHRVDILWSFHSLHHSQRDLNFFTQNRFHDVDILVDLVIRMLPLAILHASWTMIGIYSAISLAHFRLYHSRIRSNYGILRYLLVTPQSHRMHHARSERKLNCNYGGVFSMWDRVFGTQYPDCNEYPEELGIENEAFPAGQSAPPGDLPCNLPGPSEMIFPFFGR